MADFKQNPSGKRAELSLRTEHLGERQRMKGFEQRTRQDIVRAKGSGRREQNRQKVCEPLVLGRRVEGLVGAAKNKSRSKSQREQTRQEPDPAAAEAQMPNQKRREQKQMAEQGIWASAAAGSGSWRVCSR